MPSFSLALCCLLAVAADTVASNPPLSYPIAARGETLDDFHGTKVPDPYRWLEDIDSRQTAAWVEAQSKLSQDYLSAIPGRDAIAARLKEIWHFQRWSPPERYGNYWFYSLNEGLQNQPVLFVTTNPGKPGRAFFDPNKLSADGTLALRQSALSEDGKLFAYALSEAGSDWQIWRVRNVVTGSDLPDELKWSKFTGASWRKDNAGFYYTRYAAPTSQESLRATNTYQKLMYHRLGTAQSHDRLVYTRTDDSSWFVDGQVTDDGRYLIVSASHNDEVQNTLQVQDLRTAGAALVPVFPEPSSVYTFVGNVGSKLFVLTDEGAPHFRLITVNLAHPDRAHWTTVLKETPETLDSVRIIGGQLIASYLKDAHSAVRRFGLDGNELGALDLVGLGSATGFTGRIEDRETYYRYSSFTSPPSIYKLDVRTGVSSLWRAPKLAGFKPEDYETQQVFFPSKDGTKVPMFISARKGMKLDGTNPTMLYGYGGFNVSTGPSFSPAVAAWLETGGVYAVANIRGGGEYGRAWHEAGMKIRKQNVFDDFIAAAQYLIAENWTTPKRLAIRGVSNGGLLIGATMEQRPDLFAAAIPQVGVLDMLRFREFTVGKGWESDYGTVDNPEEFKALLAYSPLQNVKAGVNYPATLILTGDHDDRVFPAHSFKFAAALQYADPQGNPILLRVEERTGHGSGKPTSKQIDETADIYAFVRHAMKLD